MKLANSISIRVFSREGEDDAAIVETLKRLAPFDYEAEKIKFTTQNTTGFNETPMKIYTLLLEKERHTRKFIDLLLERISPEQKQLLLRQKESRLDEQLNFYIRLDKEKLLDGICQITDGGNCYHITISLAVFPAKRKVALKLIEQIIKNDTG